MTIKYPYHISTVAEYNKALELSVLRDKHIIIDFHGVFCKECKKLEPTFDKLSEQYKDQLVCYKVDVGIADELSELCNIRALPAIHFYKEDVLIDTLTGYNPIGLEQKFKELVTEVNVFVTDDF
jgi:thioredoxin 1